MRRRRRYDMDKFDSLFKSGKGVEIYNRLISQCRLMFIRYLDIDEKHHEGLIDNAVGTVVDRSSEAYGVMSRKIREWKKNWFFKYIKAAGKIQVELERAGPWTELPFERLRGAYKAKFSYEYLYTMMADIHAGTIDWRETLKGDNCLILYRTVFTYTMVYVCPGISLTLSNKAIAMLTLAQDISTALQSIPKTSRDRKRLMTSS